MTYLAGYRIALNECDCEHRGKSDFLRVTKSISELEETFKDGNGTKDLKGIDHNFIGFQKERRKTGFPRSPHTSQI